MHGGWLGCAWHNCVSGRIRNYRATFAGREGGGLWEDGNTLVGLYELLRGQWEHRAGNLT